MRHSRENIKNLKMLIFLKKVVLCRGFPCLCLKPLNVAKIMLSCGIGYFYTRFTHFTLVNAYSGLRIFVYLARFKTSKYC